MNTVVRKLIGELFTLVAGVLFLLPTVSLAEEIGSAQNPYRFSGPHNFKNLSVYLVHGKDQLDASKILTLDAALEAKQVLVHETGNVNTLSVENVSSNYFVFIQAGDIVKGGKQDRVLSKDLVLQPKSGKVDIASFCVEQGRWQKRGDEDVAKFSSSKKRISSKALKLAAISEGKQGEVWNQVEEVQQKLSRNVGAAVKASASNTSLQLTLENKKVELEVSEYSKTLKELASNNPDALGYIFSINGELNSADIYGAHAIFEKSWEKLLSATVTEAVAEHREGYQKKEYSEKELQAFLTQAESAEVDSKRSNDSFQTKESETSLLFESKTDKKAKNWLHRNYIKK